jgi:hypothetical protein
VTINRLVGCLPPDSIIDCMLNKVNVNPFSFDTINACNSWFIVPNNLLKLLCFEKYISNIFEKLCSTTANGGSLGSLVDEERS